MFEKIAVAFTPIIWGVLLALLLDIPLRLAEKQLSGVSARRRRGISIALVVLGFVAILFLGLWLLIPQLLIAFINLSEVLPVFLSDIEMKISNIFGNFFDDDIFFSLAQSVGRNSQNVVSSAVQIGASAAAEVAKNLYQFVLSIVLAIYFLTSKENIAHKIRLILEATMGKLRAEKIWALAHRARGVFTAFITGQCLEACVLAGLFVLALFVLGMPFALPVSVVIGVTALVPIFGSIVGASIGFVLIASVSVGQGIWFLFLFFAIQQLENHLIYPRIVGARVNLPPLWVILAVIVGNGLFGFAGLVLAIPAMSVVYNLGGEWAHEQTKRKTI